MATASTDISLYPLAVMLGAIAAVTFRTGVLPRWLGFVAITAAVALAVYAVYGSFSINLNIGPALGLWVLWTLLTSIVLFRRAQGERARRPQTSPAAAS
jgi:hypothetical protein